MAAWWTVGYLRLSLYQVSKYDPGLWAFALAVVLGSAACGALVPALRASRVDPIQALRAE
jgi:ABC-type antimicrobial peptide transport system permease subunit